MRYKPRQLTQNIQHALTTDRVVALMGSRQSGKTTLVRFLLHANRQVQYYNLKDAAVRRHLAANARKEFQYFSQHLIILDEVQKQPGLLELIQVLVDKRPSEKGQFLLLGSNHLLLNKQVKESLAGRVAIFTLFPLSFREWMESSRDSLLSGLVGSETIGQAEACLSSFHLPANEALEIHDEWKEFTVFGGYPEFITRPDPNDRRLWLSNYRQTYLETDLRELVNVRNPESFEIFEQLLATRVGSLINLSSIAGNAGISVDSVKRFLHYYRQLFMAWQCRPYYKNLASRVRKSPKWYFSDVGPLRLLLEDWRLENGHIFENCVMVEIRKSIYHERQSKGLFFSRTAAGAEVDAVFESNSGKITFYLEIKTGTRIRKADWRHLMRYVGETPHSIGLLVANVPGIVRLEDRVWGVPASWLLV